MNIAFNAIHGARRMADDQNFVCKKPSILFEMDVMESILTKIMTNYASEFSNSGSENPRQSIFPVRRS